MYQYNKHVKPALPGWRGAGEVLFLLLLCLSLTANASDLPTLAVLPVYSNGVDETKTNIIYDYIVDRVNKAGIFNLVERAALDKVFDEIEFSISDMVSEQTASEIGKMLGAEYILIASISFTENTFFLSMRIVETETARIKNTSVKNTDTFSSVESLTLDATIALFNIDAGIKATTAAGSKKLTGQCYFYTDRGNGGTSMITMGVVQNGEIILEGTVTPKVQYPYIGTGFDLNEEGLRLVKKAKGIRIKMRGDNQYYRVEVKTKSVKDFDWYHVTPFIPGKETEFLILFSDLSQGGWGKKAGFSRNEIEGINFTTVSHFNNEKVSLKVKSIEVISEEENVVVTNKKNLKGFITSWDDKGLKGTSKITHATYSDNILIMEGTTTNTISSPFIGIAITLDDESRELIKHAKGIVMMVSGEGGGFKCRIDTDGVKDFNFHQSNITVSPGFKKVTILFKELKQEPWGKKVRFDGNDIKAISFQTDGKTYEKVLLKVSEIQIIP